MSLFRRGHRYRSLQNVNPTRYGTCVKERVTARTREREVRAAVRLQAMVRGIATRGSLPVLREQHSVRARVKKNYKLFKRELRSEGYVVANTPDRQRRVIHNITPKRKLWEPGHPSPMTTWVAGGFHTPNATINERKLTAPTLPDPNAHRYE